MATLLGPHLLQDLTDPMKAHLQRWQPPVCLVLINVHQDLPKGQGLPLKPGSGKTELDRLIALVGMNTASLQTHIDIRATTPIKFIADHAQLQGTKVIGRLFLDDARVKAQITADPEKAARFHHNLVLAARTRLNDIQANLAKRVDYWVVVNEVLGTTDEELKLLGKYEMKRMDLARHGEDPTVTGYTPYGCGLFAFANATPPLPTPPSKETPLWKQALKDDDDDPDAVDYGIQAVLEKANVDNGEHSTGPQHVLLLHQYFQPDNEEFENHKRSPGVDADGYLLAKNLQNNVHRFEHHYRKDFQYGHLKVIISEYGLDGRIGLPATLLMQNPSRGWKYFDEWSGSTESESGNGQGYLNALKALDRANRGYGVDSDVILGYCIYGWGYNNADQFWSYPLDETPERPAPNPQKPEDEPEDERDKRNKENVQRGAKVIGGLVTHAESLRAQTLPPQLRLNHDALAGGGLNMREGPATDYDRIRLIPGRGFDENNPEGDSSSSWHDIVGRSADHIQPQWWQIRVCDVGPEEHSRTGWVFEGNERSGKFVHIPSETDLSGVPVVNVPPASGSKPRVESKANVVALVREEPQDNARFVQPLQGSAEASAVFSLSPRWYQVQLDNRRRGWVRASQVTAHNTDSLLSRMPRLRRWPGGREAVPVRRGPGATDATVATIAADNTAWRALLARDAAYAGWWRIRYRDQIVGWVHKDYVQTHGRLGSLAVTWNRPQLSLLATTTDGLNVRSGPGTSHGIVASIAGGSTARYDILGQDAATATWYQIRFSDELTGWVSAAHIQTHGDLTALTVTWNRTATVPRLSLLATTTDGLNVRSGPGTTHDRIASIAGGSTTRYDILGKDAATATWYQILFSDELTGWVEANDAVETEGNLNLAPPPRAGLAASVQTCVVRATPAATGTRQGAITDRDNRYVVLGKNAATAAWYRIRFSDAVDGWVHKDHVQLYGESRNLPVVGTAPPAGSHPQLSLSATTTDGLNMRTGPGTGYRIVVTLPFAATRYNILGKDAATAAWFRIQFSDEVTGWVSATHVQTHGDLSGLTVTWNPTPQLSLLATTTDGLNVRSGPGTVHNIVASIAGGSTTRYNILGKNAATATWYQIRFSSTVTGWVHGDYIRTRGDLSGLTVTWNPTPQLSLLATTTANLNVRSGPSTDHSIVGSITGGSTTRYTILGKDAATATWWQIRFSSSVTGWVHKDYVQTHGSLSGLTVTWTPPQLSLLATTTANLNVRSGPGTDHSIVGSITGGATTRYTILGKNAATATWYQIRFSNRVTGWVYATLVQTHGNLSGITVTWTPPQLSLLATTTANLNVRLGPSTSHGIVGSIAGGSTTRYEILGKNAATATWWQIRFSNSVTGWVYANLVQTHGDISGVPVR